jgi:lycopene cyclase domain-containing protein
MTIIFDSLIVVFDIVRYDSSKITSLYLGFAPIEDYIYALVAIVVIPAIWKKLGRKEK